MPQPTEAMTYVENIIAVAPQLIALRAAATGESQDQAARVFTCYVAAMALMASRYVPPIPSDAVRLSPCSDPGDVRERLAVLEDIPGIVIS